MARLYGDEYEKALETRITVAELIEKLKEFPADIPVSVCCDFDCGYGLSAGYAFDLELSENEKTLIINGLENDYWEE